MTTHELRQHVDTLHAATSADRYFVKYLFVLAKGHEHITTELVEVLYTKNRTIFSTKQQSTQEKFLELKKQGEAFPIGHIFHEIIELQRVLASLEEAFKDDERQFLAEFIRQLDTFYRAYEMLSRTGDREMFARVLIEATHLYSIVVNTRQVFATVRHALQQNRPLSPQEAQLSLLLTRTNTYHDLVQKLRAVEVIYTELAGLAGISTAECPLRVVKIETGSLWICVRGEARLINVASALLERFSLFWYNRFRIESGESFFSDRVTATQSLINLADEMERVGLRTHGADDGQMRKTALHLRRAFLELLAGEPSIQINDALHTVDQSLRERYIGETMRLLREQDETRPAAVNGHTNGLSRQQPGVA